MDQYIQCYTNHLRYYPPFLYKKTGLQSTAWRRCKNQPHGVATWVQAPLLYPAAPSTSVSTACHLFLSLAYYSSSTLQMVVHFLFLGPAALGPDLIGQPTCLRTSLRNDWQVTFPNRHLAPANSLLLSDSAQCCISCWWIWPWHH